MRHSWGLPIRISVVRGHRWEWAARDHRQREKQAWAVLAADGQEVALVDWVPVRVRAAVRVRGIAAVPEVVLAVAALAAEEQVVAVATAVVVPAGAMVAVVVPAVAVVDLAVAMVVEVDLAAAVVVEVDLAVAVVVEVDLAAEVVAAPVDARKNPQISAPCRNSCDRL